MVITPTDPPLVLVVDDDESVREFLRTLLTKDGYAVEERPHANNVVDAITVYAPDVVLLDVMMPGTDGFTALEHIRKSFPRDDLAVIMLTAKGASDDVIEAFRRGASDYLTKPFSLRVLLDRIDIQLQLHRKRGAGQLAHYRLLERIGSGGMAYVYKAQDLELDMTVAVKVIRREYADDEVFLARFRQEARLLSRVVHPNVIRFLGLEELDQTVALVMEHLDGRSLFGRVFPEPEVARIGRDVALGLRALHEAGVTHRDIKPDNVLLTADGVVKIIDLGVAAATGEPGRTQHGDIVGTPGYLSPERFRGVVGPACDVYALGCVLYEILTGVAAYDSDLEYDELRDAKESNPPLVSGLRADVSDAMDALVASLMNPKLAKRPSNLLDIAADLDAIAKEPG